MRSAFFCVSLVLAGLCAPAAHAQARSTPGLVLATDGRYATCDVLLFSPDGTQLLACGDDKVVRRWIVEKEVFSARKLAPLRWPIFREQRGSLFALAFSPDAQTVAVGGFGQPTGNVLVLDRATGDVKHALPAVPSRDPTWAVTFSPSGKHVVYGTDVGEVFVWDLQKKEVRLLPGTGGTRVNRVRRVAFLSEKKDETRFVSVAQDGKIVLGDVRPDVRPKTLDVAFELTRLYQVAIDPARRWLAAVGAGEPGAKAKDHDRVELLDLTKALEGKDARKVLRVPQEKTA